MAVEKPPRVLRHVHIAPDGSTVPGCSAFSNLQRAQYYTRGVVSVIMPDSVPFSIRCLRERCQMQLELTIPFHRFPSHSQLSILRSHSMLAP